MRNGIVEEIVKVVQARVKADNYDLVLDKSGPSLNGMPLVLASRDSWDFTTDVVTALNKTRGTAAAEPPAPAPATAPVATPKPKRGCDNVECADFGDFFQHNQDMRFLDVIVGVH